MVGTEDKNQAVIKHQMSPLRPYFCLTKVSVNLRSFFMIFTYSHTVQL